MYGPFSIKNKAYRHCDGGIIERLVFKIRRACRIAHVSIADPPCCSGLHDGVVVSLTSFPARLDKVHLAIKSIMIQSVVPAEVHLWLGEDSRGFALPKELTDLKDKGLEIHYEKGNLKGHKKYLYALSRNTGQPIITIDDDCIYPFDTIASLLEAHKRWPGSVAAIRTRRIAFDEASIKSYSDWDSCYEEEDPAPHRSLVAIGVGGVLYPPSCLPNTAFDEKQIIAVGALEVDDLWLKVMETLGGIDVVWAPSSLAHPYVINSSQETALCSGNVGKNNNDLAFARLVSHYKLDRFDFIDLE